jgi:tetratricopeptide (TPR) repeat protein
VVPREKALRESGEYALAEARKARAGRAATTVTTNAAGNASFTPAADLLARYLREFPRADSAQRVSALEAEALFASGEFLRAGTSYTRTATAWRNDSALMAASRRNASVAFDSALAHAPRDAAIRDSVLSSLDRFIALAPDADARSATIAKGRRAAEGGRWNDVATTFESFEKRWPDDPFAADAAKLVGDARYRQGDYAGAQVKWQAAQSLAAKLGRKALGDSVATTRFAAANQAADSLAKSGRYAGADSLYTTIATDIGDAALAADALRNAIELHLFADSVARVKSDTATSGRERRASISAIERLATAYPSYKHTFTYSALRAQLLPDVGRAADAVDAFQAVIAAQPAWAGRADAMVRVAGLLDSLGRKAEAAAAYDRFAASYPADKRATAARRARMDMLLAAGDTATLETELARVCMKPADPFTRLCAERAGTRAFRDGMAQWERYAALKLEIKTRAQLTQAGVAQASLPKVQALRALNAQFTKAVASGAPEWVAAGTFQSGQAQWYYGLFLRDVSLPPDLTEGQRTAASGGSKQQAQAYFDGAVKIWQALVEKAAQEKFDNDWVTKAKAALKGDGIPPREVAP